MGIIYPLFFLGAFLTAVVIWVHRRMTMGEIQSINTAGDTYSYSQRTKSRTVEGIGLFLKPDPSADISTIENLTQGIDAINAGTFTGKL